MSLADRAMLSAKVQHGIQYNHSCRLSWDAGFLVTVTGDVVS